jgi:hypothetical protein
MSAYPSPRFLNITVNGTALISGAATLSSTLNVTGAATLSSTLNVTGDTTLKKTYTVLGNYQLTGAYSNATAPWLQSITLQSPPDLSTAPTASPRDLTYMVVSADTAVVYTDATRARYGNLVTIRHLHNLGATDVSAANSWAGSRVLSKHTQSVRNHPREYLDPTASSDSTPAMINGWREQLLTFSYGGTAPFSGYAKGRSIVRYGKIVQTGGTGLTGGSNFLSSTQQESEWISTGRASSRRGTGYRMSILSMEGVTPPEGFAAFAGTRSLGEQPGWTVFLQQGVDARIGVDPYVGNFIAARANLAERTPRMQRGFDIADITFGKNAMQWLGGHIAGGERTSNASGTLRVGPVFYRGDASGGVIDAAGYIGQPVGYSFDGAELVFGNLDIPFGFTAPIFDDDYGGVYRGVLATDRRSLTSVITLIPPMADGSGGAPSATVYLTLRAEFGGAMRFAVSKTATTTSIPTNISVTTDDFFVDNGPWELSFVTGACAGETQTVTGYTAADGTLTTTAFTTSPTATVNLITNPSFTLAFPTTANTILNGWQWTVNGGTGTVTQSGGVCTIVSDGTNAADLDQQIVVVDTSFFFLIIKHKAEFNLKVGTTRGGTEMLNTVVPYTDPDDEYQTSEIPFTAIGTAAHVRIENTSLSPVYLESVLCGGSTDPIVAGVQAILRVPKAQITQTWTARSALSIQPTGGAIKLSGVQSSTSYANDAAAAAGGVAVGQVYRNGSVVQVRIS